MPGAVCRFVTLPFVLLAIHCGQMPPGGTSASGSAAFGSHATIWPSVAPSRRYDTLQKGALSLEISCLFFFFFFLFPCRCHKLQSGWIVGVVDMAVAQSPSRSQETQG